MLYRLGVKEKAFWQLIKRHLCGFPTRIENMVDPGVPDVVVLYQGTTVWLELKIANGNAITVLATQTNWMRRCLDQGGLAKVMARSKHGLIYVVDAAVILEAPSIGEGGKRPLKRIHMDDLARAGIFPPPYDWPAIMKRIFEHHDTLPSPGGLAPKAD